MLMFSTNIMLKIYWGNEGLRCINNSYRKDALLGVFKNRALKKLLAFYENQVGVASIQQLFLLQCFPWLM